MWVFVVQNRIAKILDAVEGAVRKGQKEVERLNEEAAKAQGEVEKRELLGRAKRTITQKEANTRVMLAVKSLTDGIAWRNMRFDRNIIRVLSENEATGHVESGGSGLAEDYWCHRITNYLKKVVIRNDLTNFLRIGDLTEIDYPAVFLHEIKSKVKKDGRWRTKSVRNMFTIKKGQQLSPQTRRLRQAQKIVLERKAQTTEGVVEFIDVDVPYRTYFSVVRPLIRKARREGYACRLVDDCLGIECMHWETVAKQAKEQKREVWRDLKPAADWSKKELVVVTSNFDSFTHHEGQFLRNSVPYSVFPLSVRDCADLLMGNLLLRTRLNIPLLMKKFEENGWEVTPQDFGKVSANLPRSPREVFFGDIFHESDTASEAIFFIKRGAFNLNVSFNWVHRLTMEFMTVDTLLRFVDYLHKTSVPYKPRLVAAMFKEERKLWR